MNNNDLPLLDQLLQESVRLRQHTRSDNTLKNYAFDWKTFRAWCGRFGRESLPASTETVLLYITDTLRRHRVGTAQRRFSAINFHHVQAGLEPPAGREVRALLAGAQRLRCEKPTPKLALTVEQLRQICAITFERRDPMGIRDHAILLVLFSSALRRSSLVALTLSDIQVTDRGLVIQVRREKQDQLARGRSIGIRRAEHPETCPVRAVEAWLSVRGKDPGPLFVPTRGSRVPMAPGKECVIRKQLHTETVCYVVKKAVESIGLDPALYGAHSMRSGFVTSCGEAGLSTLVIAAHTGHKSLDSLKHYFHSTDLFKANASGMIGL